MVNEFSKYVDNGNGRIWAGTPEEEQAYLAIINSKEAIIGRLELALEQHIDRVAFENGRWRNIQSAIAAASLAGPFQVQAATLAQFWTDCWEIAIQVMNDAEAGNIAVPSEQELVAMMPVFGV
jgi:hypothetical protein